MENKKEKGLSIKGEMFLISFLSFIFISMLITWIFLKLAYENNINNARNLLRECNSKIVTYTEGMFHENEALVRLISEANLVINAGYGDSSLLTEFFDSIQRKNDNITYVYAGYENGSIVINNYNIPSGFNAVTRPWYIAAKNTDGVAGLGYRDAATGEWLFSQCIKLIDKKGNMVGAAAIDCSNDSISRQLSKKYHYQSQWSFIVDLEGTILIHPQNEQINMSMLEWLEASVWENVVDGKENYAEYMRDGTKSMAYFERIPRSNFIAVSVIDASEVTKPIIKSIVVFLLFIVILSVGLGFMLSRILIRRIAKPIMELGGRIGNLAAGDLKPVRDTQTQYSNAEIKGIAENIEMIVRSITDREEKRKTAEYFGFHDSMTGLYNRRYFEKRLKQIDVQENYPLCIMCCDINGLKLTNDVFGHGIGDRLIREVAGCLEAEFCGLDIVARIGGDEFWVVLPNTSSAEAEQIKQRLKKSFPQEAIDGAVVSASVGYALKTEKEQLPEDVMKAADEMMYEEKSVESIAMKRQTMQNIISFSEKEGHVKSLSETEEKLLNIYADIFCPESKEVLLDSYRLRKIGRCSLILQNRENKPFADTHAAEMSYRILSAFEDYHNVAGYVLHSMEHWDGSGEPAGLSGRDIPLPSRIIAIVEGYCDSAEGEAVFKKKGIWYDPKLADALEKILNGIFEI